MVNMAVDTSKEVSSQFGAEQRNEAFSVQSEDQLNNWKKTREKLTQVKKENEALKSENEDLKKELADSRALTHIKARETLVKLLDCGDVNVRLQAAVTLLK